ncbi:hypothetical protein [Streptomyces spinosirectus]
MTHVNLRAGLAGCAAAASALILSSCTSGSGDGGAAGATSARPSARASQAVAEAREKKLTDQALTALAAVRSGTMVEAGAERVTDGIHTQPAFRRGRTYELNLVCFGSGSARMTFTPASAGAKAEVPCDQSLVQQRITVHRLPIRIDVDGAEGSTGMIAWRIDTA